ncbi:MAG: hypothetical protein IJ250_08215, partial [Bacteroidales bacterium]|nr:hypothetical protein [Bacteroidales bacterium]
MANNQQHLNMVDVYQLALTKVSGIGTRTAQEIVKNLGSARALFEEKEANLRIIFRNKEKTIRDIVSRKMFGICEKEIDFMQKYGIESYFFTDGNYPSRLKEIPDKPVCL